VSGLRCKLAASRVAPKYGTQRREGYAKTQRVLGRKGTSVVLLCHSVGILRFAQNDLYVGFRDKRKGEPTGSPLVFMAQVLLGPPGLYLRLCEEDAGEHVDG
jgi:hypothetical protein